MKLIEPKQKKSAEKWERIGSVGVDSGQLMVCDPCYIESEWRDTEDMPMQLHEVYQDVSTKQKWCFDRTNDPSIKRFPGVYCDPIPECNGMSPNELVKSGQWVELPHTKPSGEFSYKGCCEMTCKTKESAGELKFSRGHDGAGVVFSSGYGDGCYPVLARRNKEGRIVEVRIKMG